MLSTPCYTFVCLFLSFPYRHMAETRYAQLARDLTESIASGHYPVGSLLPTELELCEHYGASRHTVRTALRELQELGLISRRKKAGTRVETASPTAGYRQSLASLEDLVQFGATHVREVREIEDVVADRALARELGCKAGSRWLRISSLRLDGRPASAPIGWTDVYVIAAYSELRKLVRKSPDTLISSLIESRYGRRIAEVRQDIHAVLIAHELADRLQASAGSPGLKIIRRYFDPVGEMFEASVTVHPADRFVFSTRLRRSQS
jgi:GntR family transcriptional regulator